MIASTRAVRTARCGAGRVAAPPPARPVPAWRHGRVAARAAAPAVAEGMSEQEVVRLIAEKEAALASMFERRPPPKASEVAVIRREINDLKAALPGHPAPAAGAGAAGRPQPSLPARAVPSKSDKELAARVMAELQATMSGGAPKGSSADAEIARLEAENAVLRANAHALLRHQALLEQMLRDAQAEQRRVLEEAPAILERMKAKLAGGGGAGQP